MLSSIHTNSTEIIQREPRSSKFLSLEFGLSMALFHFDYIRLFVCLEDNFLLLKEQVCTKNLILSKGGLDSR